MKTFVTSDNHFEHRNIIKYCQRPFETPDEMNQSMITNWNAVVSDGDLVYVVGDFAWKNPEYWLKQLNGTKVLVKGNHDHKQNLKGWNKVVGKLETKIEGQRVTLHHYQQTEWESSFHGTWHLYGHSHGNAEEHDHVLSFDIGVDLWDFTPVEWSRIVAKMKDKEKNRETYLEMISHIQYDIDKNRRDIAENNRKY